MPYEISVISIPKDDNSESEQQRPAPPAPRHLVYVIDCSGSMAREIPHVRHQLKNRNPILANVGDMISVVWFSSQHQYGVLQEGVLLSNVQQLADLNTAIDKFLVPLSLTGYCNPLRTAHALCRKHEATHVPSVFFFTDGYENQNSKQDILSATDLFVGIPMHIIEYGFNCDSDLLQAMARRIGAVHILSKDFDEFVFSLERFLTKKTNRVEYVPINARAHSRCLCLTSDGDLVTCRSTDAAVDNETTTFHVPKDAHGGQAFIIASAEASPTKRSRYDVNASNEELTKYYVALLQAARSGDTDLAWHCLECMGDVRLATRYSHCVTKQNRSQFEQMVLDCIRDPGQRFQQGRAANVVPQEDAVTVLQILGLIQNDPHALFYPNDPAFKYDRISARYETVDDVREDGTMRAKFVANKDQGCPVTNLTFNEKQANISLEVVIYGMSVRDEMKDQSPPVPCHRFRNYTMVRNGIVHGSSRCLPFRLSDTTIDQFKYLGYTDWTAVGGDRYILNLMNLPVLSRRQVSSARRSMKLVDFLNTSVSMERAKSERKFYQAMLKRLGEEDTDVAESLQAPQADSLSQFSAEYLASMNVSPKGVFLDERGAKIETGDFEIVPELSVKLAKLSSRPQVTDALLAKFEKTPQKVTLSESLMLAAYVRERKHFQDCNGDGVRHAAFLKQCVEECNASLSHMSMELLRQKWAILIGQAWFSDVTSGSTEPAQATIVQHGQEFTGTVQIQEIRVPYYK